MMTNKMSHKSRNLYSCIICDYNTCRLSDYNKHKLTSKHINRINPNDLSLKISNKFICKCGKEYKHASSLCNHKKKCDYKENNEEEIKLEEDNINYKELVMKLLIDNQEIKNLMMNSNQEIIKENQEIIKENKELRKQIVEMVPKVGNNNNNTNNVKQKFNINVFLNEKCKDAISMDQFIDKLMWVLRIY